MKLEAGQRLVVASHNAGKVREINELINPFGLDAVSAAELNLAEPVEDGDSFASNALIKARAATKASGLVALADDSGLEVAALDGAPGIYSARWAGEDGDFKFAMERVNNELVEKGLLADADRGANFSCALALTFPSGEEHVFEGQVFGTIVWPPRGDYGFGYDPLFVPLGDMISFGEMDPVQKHKISHRANAFQLFKEACLAHLTPDGGS